MSMKTQKATLSHPGAKCRDFYFGGCAYLADPVEEKWQLNKESKERQLGVAFIDPQMFSAVINRDPDHDTRDDKNVGKSLEKQQLIAIREKIASFLLVDVISDKGDFHCRS
ncbi:hypothetical protein C2845_PM17G04600 [Panicum miliaceum]|uniref:Uncharacterized protein n=1 Tax=Panicum miliaceum TaxID=4540 RepID=A0A3L6Q487_PANMI|nr:hypothetical protein C2845_PM17G04600 [Panicum miliaceum]